MSYSTDTEFAVGCFMFIVLIIVFISIIGGGIWLITYVIKLDESNIVLPENMVLEYSINSRWAIIKDNKYECFLLYRNGNYFNTTKIGCEFLKKLE